MRVSEGMDDGCLSEGVSCRQYYEAVMCISRRFHPSLCPHAYSWTCASVRGYMYGVLPSLSSSIATAASTKELSRTYSR